MSIPIQSIAHAVMRPSDQGITQYKSKQIYQALHKHGVAELAYKHFEHKPALNDALSVRAKTSIATEMARAYEIEQLIHQLDSKNIKYIIFKGSALAYFSYKNAWQRSRGDTDILIDFDKLNHVSDILTSLGYKAETSISGKYISYQKSFCKKVTSGFVHTFDVHWKVSNRQILAANYTLTELLNNSRKVILNDTQEMNIPGAIDSILLAATHRKGHHPDKERLIWLYDIHLLCNEMKENQWPMLIAKARKKQISAMTFEALDFTRAIFDTRLPKMVTDSLTHESIKPEPSEIFLDEDRNDLAVFWTDLKYGLPNWSSRLCLIKEHLIPSKDYLKQTSGGSNWLSSLFKRLFSGIKKKLKTK